MTAGLEGITVTRWVWGRLAGDPDLADLAGGAANLEARLSEGSAPDVGADWWVTWTVLEPVDVKTAPLVQVMARVQVQVKVTCPGASYAPIVPVYGRIHTLLESQANQDVTDGHVLTCGRLSGLQYPERTNGIDYRNLGGLYETHAQ